MNVVKALLAVVAALVMAAVLVAGCVDSGYNKAVTLDEEVSSQWAEVENQLQRRFDLIDNLVGTVKGVAEQEQEVFLGIAKSREAYFQAKTVREKAAAAGSFESALSRLLVMREAYPELKSNESFLKLQDQLEGTENRLSVARKRYNEKVKELNAFTRKLLGRFYASLADVEKAEYFEVEEAVKAAPKVDFSDDAEGP